MSGNIFEEIKDLAEIMGGRYVIVENNRPRYVIMSFEEYRQLGEKMRTMAGNDNFSEANTELEELKTQDLGENNPNTAIDFTEESGDEAGKRKPVGDLELSDLPF